MPYGNQPVDPERKRELDMLYAELVKPAVESVLVPGPPGEHVVCHRADHEPRPGEIVLHIIENLVLSEIAVADLTGRNPNVFYELGVRHAVNDNTILIAQSEEDIPVDLRGQRYLIYQRDFPGGIKLRNKLAEAVEEIVRSPSKIDNPVRRFLYNQEKEKIETQGRPPGYDFVRELLQEVSDLRKDFKTQLAEVRYVLNAVTGGRGTSSGEERDEDLRFLAGAWQASSGSNLYIRWMNRELVAPYCYAGDESLTGRFYNFRRIADTLFARFEWLPLGEGVSGYAMWRVVSRDRLDGGWWHSRLVPQDVTEDITRMTQTLPGMSRYVLKRVAGKETPAWAEEYFSQIKRTGKASPTGK
jgi:hypothetical protein